MKNKKRFAIDTKDSKFKAVELKQVFNQGDSKDVVVRNLGTTDSLEEAEKLIDDD